MIINLQDKKVRLAIRGNTNKGFSGIRRFVARFSFSCTLIGNHPQSLTGQTAKPLPATLFSSP